MQPQRQVFLRVRGINSQNRQFSDLDLVPDLASTPPEELAEIIRLADSKSLGDNFKLIRYRHRFTPGAMNLAGVNNFSTVFLPNYFEDEAGKPLGRFGMMQTLTGERDVLVLGDPESVWHIGATPM